MKYDPKDADSNLIAEGEFDAEIKLAEDAYSKAGNEMMKLTIHVWAGAGGPRVVFDYAVVPGGVYKLKQIAAALGIMPKFESGSMGPPDIIGASLRVLVKTEKSKGDFPAKNVIARYLPSASASPATAASPPGKIPDDDIPF